MESKRNPKEQMLWKMNNVLRGQAMFIKDDTITPSSEKAEMMEIIETFKHFLDHYDEYTQVIQQYEESKQKDRDGYER